MSQTLRPSPTARLNPRMDPTFKAIFTQETTESYEALKSFISSVLGRQISKIQLTTNEPYVDIPSLMQMAFDVSVIFEDGERASIEMQGREQDYSYETRSEVQVARLLNNNVKKGSNWQSEKVYQISVLNFHLPKDDNSETSWYTMKNQNGHELSGHLNVIFIDLLVIKELVGTPVEKLTPLQKWGLYFSYADDESKSDYIKQIVETEKGIMEADLIVTKMSEEDANWFRQNSIDTAMRDRNDALYNSEQRGRRKGAMEKSIEAALILINDFNVTPEVAAKKMGAPLDALYEALKAKEK